MRGIALPFKAKPDARKRNEHWRRLHARFFDGATGALVDLGDVQDVKIDALKHDIKSQPYNQVPRYGYVPDGFKIDFTITRTGSALEDFMVAFSKTSMPAQ